MASGVGVDVGEGVGSWVAVGKAACLAGLITLPLFQTSFLPNLTHLNCLPPLIFVIPILLQTAPAFGGVAENAGRFVNIKASAKTKTAFFMRVRVFLHRRVIKYF